jgi:hypothetical protein
LRIKEEIDVEEFFALVDQCKGSVHLVTETGGRLDLKSKLSQYVSMVEVFGREEGKNLEILIDEEEDSAKLLKFIQV